MPFCSSSEGRSHDNVILRDVSTVTLTFSGVSVGAIKSESKHYISSSMVSEQGGLRDTVNMSHNLK